MTPREAAYDYMRRGIPVFPCRPNTKFPAVPHWKTDAGTDPRIIETWHPECNIATSPDWSGCLVIDLDGELGLLNWVALEAQHGPAPTLRVQTPSGGLHLWYRGQGPSTVGKLAKNIDTRGVGGYVLLPPSIIDGRSYMFLDGASLI
jgi:hypothetical protein